MKIVAGFHLPFKLPVEDGIKFYSAYINAEFIAEFNSYNKTIINEGIDVSEVVGCTIVNITYMPKDEYIDGLKQDEVLRRMVLDSIHYLNRLLDSIRSHAGLDYVHNITIADLPMILLIAKDEETYIYATRPQEIMRPEATLSLDDMVKIGSVMHSWDLYPDVFLVEKFFDSAKAHLNKEQLLDAVIDLQTSFEILIRNTHRLILTKNGSSQEVIDNASSIAFRNVIEQHIAKQLDVDLNFINPGVINEWYIKLYSLRNQIVHQGRIDITGEEAFEAYDAYVNARNYLGDKLNDKGYINSNGKVDLKPFKKNLKGSIDGEAFIERLKKLGLIEDSLIFNNQETCLANASDAIK
jgi:hypothetical protein